jgi:hypothetical protein
LEENMKFAGFVAVALLTAMLSLNAQAQTAGPLLWTSYIDVLGNYVPTSGGGTFSRFTPGVPITVTRMQLQAAQGSYIYGTKNKCHPLPKIRVTDGATNYDLAIPNARFTGRYPNAVSADSGVISVSFSGTPSLRMVVIPGEKNCNPGSINVTVQYSVN